MFALVLASQVFVNHVQSQDWPQFLGPKGNSSSSDVVPTTWSETENMLWKFDLPGAGSSSPIVVGDRIFVTCYSRDGNSVNRHVVCVNKHDGKQIWARQLDADYREDGYNGYLTEHGYASNTPVSDGESVFVFLGKGGVHAFDLDGNKKWSTDIGKGSSNRQWGSAASPVLYNDIVIVNAAEESKAIIALNKNTGKETWRQDADMLELAYGTPRVVAIDGKNELILNVPGEMWALNPDNGKIRWYAETQMTGNVSPSVIVQGSTIYGFGGYRSFGSIAVRAGGRGDVTKTNVIWSNRSSSYVATPLLHDQRFYWIDDRGVAYCTSAETGDVVYRERVSGLTGRPVYASPAMIGKHIYVVSRRAGTIVYTPGQTFEPIARNVIAGDETDFNASPVVSDGKLYLRSNQALYCIGKPR
jgi:outer membrane protein assembly factor BamB